MKTLIVNSNVYKELSDLTSKYLPKDTVKLAFDNQEFETPFGTKNFNLITKKQTEVILKQLKEMKDGELLLYVEQDTVLFDPQWFETQIGDNDMIAQNDNNMPCLGLFVVRNSQKIRNAFEITAMATTQFVNNQEIFNRLLGTFQLKIAYFDTKDVWNYGCINKRCWEGEDFVVPDNLKAFHANWTIGKENKLKLLNKVLKEYA